MSSSGWGWGTVLLAASIAFGACAPVHSTARRSSRARRPPGPVWLSGARVPLDAVEVGVVLTMGTQTNIEELIPEFMRRVIAVGGNFGKVDTITTRYELQTHVQTYSYVCGARTCTGDRPVTVEVGTTQVVGRAFRVPRGSP